jgi:DNA-binding CsgD family transcriptional regulator
MSLAEPRHRAFIEETMRHQVDQQQNLCDFVLEEVPVQFHEEYLREMYAVDPLHVQRISGRDLTVARLADAARYASPEQVERYGRFLRSFAVVDTMELLFRNDREILAGLNIAWTEGDLPTSAATYAHAEQLQRYVQFTMLSRLAAASEVQREAVCSFRLTPREQEVALLVCEGRGNAAIAACLGIELSTVKTHLVRIYEKCEVDSRSGLVARLNAPD